MKYLVAVLSLVCITSCMSVKTINRQRKSYIQPEDLKSDVDFAHKKLEALHPNLYWYISKKDLDFKFDSLKNTINKPLTPIQFYFKLQPVISQIREGHLTLRIPDKKYSKKYLANLKDTKGLFSRLDYYIEDNRLFVEKNKDSVQNIQPGTEILSINDVPVSKNMEKYNLLISSDGYNTTFKPYFLKDVFFNFYTVEHGILDSVKIKTQYKDEVKTLTLKRENKNSEELKKDRLAKKRTSEKKINDYVFSTDSYNRNFKFLDKDSSIAYIKVKSFSETHSKKFYKDSFKKIQDSKSDFLVIDIRNNYGGSLAEIHNLYSYIAKEPYSLIKPAQITSSSSPLKTNYFRKSNSVDYLFKTIAYPGYVFSHLFSSYKGKDGNYYYKIKASKPTPPKTNAFRGKIFVLINGGSFSASSIIASKLKDDKRVTLVGEETGGANDGTVAGFYSYQVLPNSKIDLPIGLVLVQPNIQFTNTQKGVTPDIEIKETLEDRLEKKDKALTWIMDEIKKEKKALQ